MREKGPWEERTGEEEKKRGSPLAGEPPFSSVSMNRNGSGDRSLIRFCLKDIYTPGRALIHQVSSRRDRLRFLNAFLLCVPFLICI